MSISDFTNLVEGESARDTNTWTRRSPDPKELLPADISKVEFDDAMMAFLKTYRYSVLDKHTGDLIPQEIFDFDFKDTDFYNALYGAVGNWPSAFPSWRNPSASVRAFAARVRASIQSAGSSAGTRGARRRS